MADDRLWTCDIETLLRWILEDEKKGRIFGIHHDLFFTPARTDPFRTRRYGQLLETPLGVAAGPHTQLSQNIISAWLAGARYMELKTVQVLDELEVTKPCIDMTDEGYNCEWSQELKLNQSYDEYLNAWIILHILKDKFGWGNPGEPGFIFNMSVGYNLEGILSPTVQEFLDKMNDCSTEKSEKIERLAEIYPRVRDLEIPDRISDNITISTMHGCPPDEVEKIGHYFVSDRGLNTTIKLNPTLLGPERLRGILNDKLGFETVVPDLAFDHDLKYEDGIALIRSLLKAAEKNGVAFNIKLTNTLETTNLQQNLPKSEQMVYMSGRALHPISINLAAKIQSEFDGSLDISFSAGSDCFNFVDTLACGLSPVTVCTDILKPGGYGRLSQYLEVARQAIVDSGAGSIDEFITRRSGSPENTAQAGLKNLRVYAETVADQEVYKKNYFPYQNIKTPRALTAFDCIQAPCVSTCPVAQDVPGYMYHTARGEYDKAFQAILASNPFPNVQGMVCDHLCQEKCTRLNYDTPLLIREIKRFIAGKFEKPIGLEPAPANGVKVGIIGAGPSGLACAHFLALEGFEVHVYEKKAFAGGWASDAIPAFRLDDNSINKDIDAILSLGVTIHYQETIDGKKFDQLRDEHAYLYIAIGAQEGIALGIEGEEADGVMDQLDFLSAVRRGQRPGLGEKVAVIGGGNSAMDAARTAKRLVGANGEVTVIYRRTQKEMPAAAEEIHALLDEDINLLELTSPDSLNIETNRVKSITCCRMELGEPDASGRPRPVRIENSQFDVAVDGVISAIGQQINIDFLSDESLTTDAESHETQMENVFAGGDAIRGASTLINAIGDGKKVAEAIITKINADFQIPEPLINRISDAGERHKNRGRRQAGSAIPEIGLDERGGFDLVTRTLDDTTAQKEAARCLYCDELCSVCVSVCPNRANMEFEIDPVQFKSGRFQKNGSGVKLVDTETIKIQQRTQVLNVADFCNECGNCATFCPTAGSPYRDKTRIHIRQSSFDNSTNGFYFVSADQLLWKEGERAGSLSRTDQGLIFQDGEIRLKIDPNSFTVEILEIMADSLSFNDTRQIQEMVIVYLALKNQVPFGVKT